MLISLYGYYSLSSICSRGDVHKVQDQQGAIKRIWSTFHEEVQKVKDVDAFVNHGLVIILPLLTFSMWLSW